MRRTSIERRGRSGARFMVAPPVDPTGSQSWSTGLRREPIAVVFSDPQLATVGKRFADLVPGSFVTGEVSEPMVHLARETGVAYFAAGHHATERFGVQALGQAIADRFGIQVRYLEVDSPV